MDKELINAAAQTFCLAPEVYKDIFKQGGADIPDEVVQAIQQQPEKGMEILQKDENILKAVVEAFNANQDAIMQYVQEKQSKASKMFNGGKLGYLARKFQGGGINPSQAFNIKEKNLPAGARRAAKNNTKPVPDVTNAVSRRMGAAVDASGTQYAYERATIGEPGKGTSTETYVTINPAGDTLINQTYPISSGDFVTKTYTNKDWQYDQIMPRFRMTGIFDALRNFSLKNGGTVNDKINNKYFNLLSKAGRKSSKEMEDLMKQRNKEINK